MKTAYAAALAAAFMAMLLYGLFGSGGFTGEKEKPETDPMEHGRLKKAYFGMGCFWGVEALFGGADGVVLTRVGYAGGTKDNPTYHGLGDHTETVEVTYDPAELTYTQLLDVFWSSHNPGEKPYSRQYINAVFYATEDQKKMAEASKPDGEVNTAVLPLKSFTPAEDYHQKYHLRHSELMEDFRRMYSSEEEFINSAAATRANAAAAGYGSEEGSKSCG